MNEKTLLGYLLAKVNNAGTYPAVGTVYTFTLDNATVSALIEPKVDFQYTYLHDGGKEIRVVVSVVPAGTAVN